MKILSLSRPRVAQLTATACALSALSACTFPSDGSRDDVRSFDAQISQDTAPPMDVTAVDANLDADASLDAADAATTDAVSLEDVLQCSTDGGSLVACGNACVDTSRDTAHCGRCNSRCSAGTECVSGRCDLRCSVGTVRCGTECIDPANNPRFCNADATCTTFTACTAGQVCASGRCIANCQPGAIVCNGQCVDPQSSPAFCGARTDCMAANAGAVCTMGQVCSMGACTLSCSGSSIACSGSCIDPNTNRMFCGATTTCTGPTAGVACAAGEVCLSGRCTRGGCATGTVLCGSSCVDPLNDRRNCGARGDCAGTNAGQVCATGSVCLGGACIATMPPLSVLGGSVDNRVVQAADARTQQLAAPQDATFYYTLDGSEPIAGAMGTRAAMGRTVSLPNLGLNAMGNPDCMRVRWFADYGAALGREAVQERTLCSDPTIRMTANPGNAGRDPFELVSFDEISLESGGTNFGPLALVERGASVVMRFRLRNYPALSQQRQAYVQLEGPTGPSQIFCHWVNTVRDERFPMAAPLTTFTAPTTPGRYAISWNQSANTDCRLPARPDFRPIAVLIVR
ncbi:MAG: hypothetical protein Q8Q09_22595 [Deltaproteobacteria bacterium]|nr:hypothetical protein [Deltaproteobacteria bacterium]